MELKGVSGAGRGAGASGRRGWAGLYQAAACGENTERILRLDELFDQHHPAEPHHHLAFLAVRPEWQRQRFGSALLSHCHAQLDTAGVAAYLEATSEGARDLYTRRSYRTREPFRLPNEAPMWPMWRPSARVLQ